MQACVGGLSLAEVMVGYERAIVVDAMLTGKHAVGTVKQLSAERPIHGIKPRISS